MRLLLDTHVLLWSLCDPSKLPVPVVHALTAPENEVYVSLVSLWEIEIKASLNKLDLPLDYEDVFPKYITESRMKLLPIEVAHTAALCKLVFNHRDPFDRMLIVQAEVEGMALVSADTNLRAYDLPILWS